MNNDNLKSKMKMDNDLYLSKHSEYYLNLLNDILDRGNLSNEIFALENICEELRLINKINKISLKLKENLPTKYEKLLNKDIDIKICITLSKDLVNEYFDLITQSFYYRTEYKRIFKYFQSVKKMIKNNEDSFCKVLTHNMLYLIDSNASSYSGFSYIVHYTLILKLLIEFYEK